MQLEPEELANLSSNSNVAIFTQYKAHKDLENYVSGLSTSEQAFLLKTLMNIVQVANSRDEELFKENRKLHDQLTSLKKESQLVNNWLRELENTFNLPQDTNIHLTLSQISILLKQLIEINYCVGEEVRNLNPNVYTAFMMERVSFCLELMDKSIKGYMKAGEKFKESFIGSNGAKRKL